MQNTDISSSYYSVHAHFNKGTLDLIRHSGGSFTSSWFNVTTNNNNQEYSSDKNRFAVFSFMHCGAQRVNIIYSS